MTTIQEQIKLLQAVADGKTLQYQGKNSYSKEWLDASDSWHRDLVDGRSGLTPLAYNWRIKPEPEVKWLNVYPNGSAIAYISEADAKSVAGLAEDVKIAVKYQEVL